MNPRRVVTIERRSEVHSDPDGQGTSLAVIRPRFPGREYITLVLGDVPKDAPVTYREVLEMLLGLTTAVVTEITEAAEGQS